MTIFNTMSLSLPEMYERFLVTPLFRPFAEELLTRVKPTAADSVLDVACGTGIVARIARERIGPAARIVGVDASPGMLAAARGVDATIDWREGNAVALPLHDGERFAVVTCHQGLQFFPDKPAAARQMRSALADNGRLAVGTWLSIPDIPYMRDLDAVARRHLGPFTDSRHSFGDAGALQCLLADAGFSNVQVNMFSHDVQVPIETDFARLNALAVVGMSAAGKTMDDAERAALVERIATDSIAVDARYTMNGWLTFTLTTHLATASA